MAAPTKRMQSFLQNNSEDSRARNASSSSRTRRIAAQTWVIPETGCWVWMGKLHPTKRRPVIHREDGEGYCEVRWYLYPNTKRQGYFREFRTTCEHAYCLNPDHMTVTHHPVCKKTEKRSSKGP
jgi:hypothetical protein